MPTNAAGPARRRPPGDEVVTDTPHRIAIVGVGPRGFGCLERLAIELARTRPKRAVHITLHDRAAHPGAGPIYDPEQPDELLMNLSARHVTAWSADADDVAAGRHEDLLSWLGRHHAHWATADAYVPRKLVGAYLREAYEILLGSLPAGVQVTPVPATATDLQRVDDGWFVRHEDPTADLRVDEVVCTAGHGVWPTGPAAYGSNGLPSGDDAAVVARPYPVRRVLSVARVPPGSVVGVRGFALSFIDVALSLTVGRGGSIDGVAEFGRSGSPWPGYHPGASDAACIVPCSRTGAPLLAKPGPALVAESGQLVDLWTDLRASLRDGDTAEPVDEIARTLARAAAMALHQLGAPVDDRTRATIGALLAPDVTRSGYRDVHDGPAALAAMKRSVEVALGHRAPDAGWAVGEAWRRGYPGLVARVGHGGLPERSRPRFAALARRLERVGFGPPPENVLRLIALAEAGTLDLGYLQGRVITTDQGRLALREAGRTRPVDVVVDSVLPPPGADRHTPLWGALLHRGAARLGAGTSGIEVADDATCIGRDGRRTPGLAAVGRATEGWVLGNDTLNRTLHAETERWARRIAQELRGQDAPSRHASRGPTRAVGTLGALT